jgi:hypothetical protein
MATYTYGGTNYTLMATPMVGTWPFAAQSRNAKVYCMSDECFATSTGTAGSHFYLGGLPAGAVPLVSVIWPIDSDTYGEGDNWAAAATGQLGILATTGADAIAADPDLFGDVTDLNASALPRVIEPCPDGTIYTSTLDFALRQAVTPVMLTADNQAVSTEGVALKMLYTHGGRTY